MGFLMNSPESGIVDLDQIKKFTWSKCAQEQINVYKELYENNYLC